MWPNPVAYGERVLVQTPTRNFTALDTAELLELSNCSTQTSIYNSTKNLAKPLIPPRVNLVCVYGEKVPTPIQYQFGTNSLPALPKRVIQGSGDGEQDNITNSWCW